MATVRVVAPFVTLPVKDVAGATVVTGFYEGMLAEGVEGESLERHLRKGMVEEVDAPAEPEDLSALLKADLVERAKAAGIATDGLTKDELIDALES